MNKMARNALKGYVYQDYIFTLFLAKMDTERKILRLESEALNTEHFDDICVIMEDGNIYRVQAKNYQGTTIEDISVSDDIVTIKSNVNSYNSADNNIMVINTNKIDTNTTFMGMPAVVKNGITIIPMTEEQVTDQLDSMFKSEERELQIIQKAIEYTCMAKFEVDLKDLPDLIKLSTSLQHETIILRKVPKKIEKGITYIVGKPGVGKSHFVDELVNSYPDALVYRFWVCSQDDHLTSRLHFNKFLTEIGMLVFKSPRNFTIAQLISQIVNENFILIIDGLDHVENYNVLELHKYIDFINALGEASARVIVLSRPLKETINWNKTELPNWNVDETRLYLHTAHDIYDYSVQLKIFEISEGYPIITYFLAEHYKKHGDINLNHPVDDLFEYYDNLLSNVRTKSLFCVFATNNSFFTWKELSNIVSEPELYDALSEFVNSYPYLFNILENRISLIHDSFNTYLRGIITSFPEKQKKVIDIVKDSLEKGNVEYMARLASFDLDDDFLNVLIKKYSSFDVFKQLLNSTIDYNSITSFYKQLQHILETHTNTLDIYQYYSFSLIYQVVTRNNLVGCDGLIYQLLLYIHNHGGIENQILSSGIIWNTYLACKGMEQHAEKFIKNLRYSEHHYYDLIKSINNETSFYDQLDMRINFSDIEPLLYDSNTNSEEKAELIEEYLISIWINKDSNAVFYDEIVEFIETENKSLFYPFLKKYGFDNFWISIIPERIKTKLHELGFFGDENIYRGKSIIEKIKECAPDGSFSVAPVIQSVLRLANHEKREIDIFSVNYVWTMYLQRKDYSVCNIDDALIIFEEEGLISEKESIELIHKLMAQSEKGIRHLMSSYINRKGSNCTKRLIDEGYFNNSDFKAYIFDLSPENINCFTKHQIKELLNDMVSSHYYSKTIEARDICNILESDYCDLVLDALEYYELSILGTVRGNSIEQKLNERGIKYYSNHTEEKKKYVPFDGGYIHDEDEIYIRDNGIKALEIAQYTDGWYSCLPYPEMYQLYEKDELQRDYLDIVHKSMYARVIDKEYVGNWDLLLGNIPKFLKVCSIEVEWIKLFEIFKQFLEVSLIYLPEK